MASIAIQPIVLNDITLSVAADNYESSVSRVELVPTTPTVAWKGMSPAANINLAGVPTWVANIDYAQDHATASSFSQYLQANAGTVKTMKFAPKKGATGSTPTFTVDVLIVAGPIGGALDTVAVGSVSLPVNGQPARALA